MDGFRVVNWGWQPEIVIGLIRDQDFATIDINWSYSWLFTKPKRGFVRENQHFFSKGDVARKHSEGSVLFSSERWSEMMGPMGD